MPRTINYWIHKLAAIRCFLVKLTASPAEADQSLGSQRMCPFCGLITPRSERRCLECGKPLRGIASEPKDAKQA